MYDNVDAFKNAMFNAGIRTDAPVIPDGKIHRGRGEGSKGLPVWFRLSLCARYGSFGDWRSGLNAKWTADGVFQDEKLYRKIQKEMAQQKRQRDAKQMQAKRTAQDIWRNAKPVSNHPYLTLKNVNSYGLRTDGERIIVPVFIDREIWSLQFIDGGGGKRFLTGGRVKGGYFSIGQPTQRIWVAEGYATAATVHAATQDAALIAFNCGNLPTVTKRLKERFSGADIYIASDNDESGQRAADKSLKVGARGHIAPAIANGVNDWNDYAQVNGIDATREALREVML